MTINELLSLLRSLDVKVWVDGDRLRCNAPPGVLTPELKSELVGRKAELVNFLRVNSQSATLSTTPLRVETGSGPKRVSFAQQRLWFLDQMEPGNANYNIWGLAWVNGSLNLLAFEQAVVEILRRHESLRTSFINEEGTPKPVIGEAKEWKIEIVDLTDRSLADGKHEAIEFAVREGKRPFDLTKSPLLRVVLMRISGSLHGFFLSVHHIVYDGLSFGVFNEELRALYAAFQEGRPSPLPPLPLQYSDFANWQRERWDRGEIHGQLDYWKKQLGGKLPVLELPCDRVRPKVQTFRGNRLSAMISESITTALRELTRDEKVTLFMTLLAAFKVLLLRYTGQEDVIVGTPVAGRTRVEFENLIGFFINTLVLRTDLSGAPTFRELLARVREVALQAYANQDVPFDQLVEVLRPERSVSHPPLFQVMFTLQPHPIQDSTMGKITLSPEQNLESGTARLDLTVDVFETQGEGLKAFFEYNTDLFEKTTIERFQAHFTRLLESIVANPDQPIGKLELLTKDERERVILEWNSTKSPYPKDLCVHQLIEAQATKAPGRIALQFGDVQWTYAELDRRANQLARYLVTLGVGPEVLVGICLERSPLMVQAVLATMKAGGAYVPLDPVFPKDRLAFMLKDSRLSVLLTQEQLMTMLPEHEARVVCLDSAWEMIEKTSTEPLDNGSTAENLAYVIYTSGSTGKPKGVQILHRSVVNFLRSMSREPGLTQDDRLLSVTTLSFDIAGLELYLPLIIGARVVLASRAVSADALRLIELIEQCDATAMQATPASWRMLIEAGWEGKRSLKMLCGGEALSRELADQLIAKGSSLWNMYGPTETTIWSTHCRVPPGEGIINIGRPIANTQVYILDQYLQPVPVGVVGELLIGGDGLARGYLHRPELTRERFISDPFSAESAARLYKTGDLARYRPDGVIECMGRLDHQVKIRGFRIELGEIEASLTRHPDVQQAVVVAREDHNGDRQLVAYVVRQNRVGFNTSELRNYLKESLPEYMVPPVYVVMDTLPQTPNGKVDRNALPDPAGQRIEESSPFVSPRTPLEQSIATIWQEVLKVERVGLEDNFFDLGGHSLLIVKVFNKLKQISDFKFTLVDMFQHPTVGALSSFLDRQGGLNHYTSEIHRVRANRQSGSLNEA